METNFNFKSSVCTSKEQSERLLALGLKKETADMWRCLFVGGETLVPTEDVDLYNFYVEPIPAWSLGRLIEIVQDKCYRVDTCFEMVTIRNPVSAIYHIEDAQTSIYDNLISCIEWLIKEGYFPKEYLV